VEILSAGNVPGTRVEWLDPALEALGRASVQKRTALLGE
jgi:hypothetical protein